MPQFDYIALDAKGQEVTGSMSAQSDSDVIAALREEGYYPTSVVEAGLAKADRSTKKKIKQAKDSQKKRQKVDKTLKRRSRGVGRVKAKVLMIFTRQLATLIDAGLPLLKGLTVLGDQEPNPKLKTTVNALADSIQSGNTFSESLAQHSKIFNNLYVNMVKAGELGGVLEIVLLRLAEFQEKAQKLKNKIVTAMVYPTIVLSVSILILMFLLIFIVPKFEKMFAETLPGQELPWLTQMVIGASRWVGSNILYLGLGAAVIIFAWITFKKTLKGTYIIDRLQLRLPMIGNVLRKSSVSRFARTLGTLVNSGVPILQALTITKETAGNVIVADAISSVHDSVKEGDTIASPLQASGVFPPMVVSMINVGEETGQLPDMLIKVADVYEDEVDTSVTAMTSLLEPMMVVFLALIVGTIVIALFLPIVKMISGLDQAM